MFIMPMPQLPPEVMDAVQANPDAFAGGMSEAMEAFTAATEGGADLEVAFEAFGEVLGPVLEGMGVSPEIVEATGDLVGAAVGPSMSMAPADASGDDMGAILVDAIDMMTEGNDVPPTVSDALADMGQGIADSGVGAHDLGSEMSGPVGGDTYLLPTDGNGDPLLEPGQPETIPEISVQSPPADGAMAANGNMPPVDGYDHIDVQDDFVMPDSGTPDGEEQVDTAMDATNAGGTTTETGDGAGGSGGLSALNDSIGDDGTAEIADNNGPDQNDTAVGAAMDSATEQGGGQGSGAGQGQDFGDNGEGEEGNDSQDVDSSAGMG